MAAHQLLPAHCSGAHSMGARMGEAVGKSAAGNSEQPNVSLRGALGASSGRSDEEGLQNSFFSVATLIKIHYFDISCSKPVSRGEVARPALPFAPASSCWAGWGDGYDAAEGRRAGHRERALVAGGTTCAGERWPTCGKAKTLWCNFFKCALVFTNKTICRCAGGLGLPLGPQSPELSIQGFKWHVFIYLLVFIWRLCCMPAVWTWGSHNYWDCFYYMEILWLKAQ